MQFIRKTFLGLTASLLFSALLAFGLSFGAYKIFGTPDAIKHALKDSGFYQTIVGDALDQAQKQNQKEQGTSNNEEGLPLDNPEVREALQGAASPEFLQTQVEGFLDSMYAWLQGKTPHWTTTIDVAGLKSQIANGLGEQVTKRLAGLPACAPGTPVNQDIDPFAATCLPQGTNAGQVSAQVTDKLGEELGKAEFFKQNTIDTGATRLDNGKTLEEQFALAPKAVQGATQAMYWTGVLAVLLAAGVVLLSQTRRLGLKKVAITALIVGALTTLLGWGAAFAFSKASATVGQNEPLQQTVLRVGHLLSSDLRFWWMGYGLSLLGLGIGIFVALRLTRPKEGSEPHPAADVPDQPANDIDQPQAEPPKRATKAKPPKLIQ